MRGLYGLLLWTLLLAADSNLSQSFDIDREIDRIMHAPPEQRRLLMNALKRKIFQLNLEIQSTQLLNLQRLLNLKAHKRGRDHR
ncbi:MAG: hypothetical protein GXO19_04175 [Epsilonproteobacteria bacterium]|nr:hypothetical protein [Campylobacterota bacterium]NPA56919.1 hypothetical protein [Campylobacterota bacterium]